MKVTKEKYRQIKNLIKLGIARKEITDITGVGRSTIARIRKSTSFNNYHEVSHKDVPSFYSEYGTHETIPGWAVIVLVGGIALMAVYFFLRVKG